jgi:amino acid transporter
MMVGLVLWVQETYDLYATWAYAWALVAPTGVGLGMLFYGLVHRDRELAADGLRTTVVGLCLFFGFAFFFEGVIGLSGKPLDNAQAILPYVAIGIGILLVVISFVSGGRRRDPRP